MSAREHSAAVSGEIYCTPSLFLLPRVIKEVNELCTVENNVPVGVDLLCLERGTCLVVGYFRQYIRLCQEVWLRTVFAVVIGDVGVIIEDLEEQQSYFGVIDFLTATGNVIEKVR